MSATVYFASARSRSHDDNKLAKIGRLAEAVGLGNIVAKDDLTAVKLHFGERGNDTHLKPVYLRRIVDAIRALGGKPFLTDTNTLYSGSRINAVDHLLTAYEHGYAYSVVNAPVIISDGLKGNDHVQVAIGKKRFQEVTIARGVRDADAMVVMTHFKGHMIAGFGGSIKNLAMGCAPGVGKKAQHSPRLKVDQDKCIGCGACADVCPAGAAAVGEDGKASVNVELCIGCFECCTVCPEKAVAPEWFSDVPEFMERMTEYAYGAVANKAGKICYFNFLENITPDCDCVPWSDTPMVPDIGILAGTDPVAIDKASYDLVTARASLEGCKLEHPVAPGEDKFKCAWEHTHGLLQITYGQEIGLGDPEYTLVEI